MGTQRNNFFRLVVISGGAEKIRLTAFNGGKKSKKNPRVERVRRRFTALKAIRKFHANAEKLFPHFSF